MKKEELVLRTWVVVVLRLLPPILIGLVLGTVIVVFLRAVSLC